MGSEMCIRDREHNNWRREQDNQPLQVMGRFTHFVKTDSEEQAQPVEFVVSKTKLNLLGRSGLRQLNVDKTPFYTYVLLRQTY